MRMRTDEQFNISLDQSRTNHSARFASGVVDFGLGGFSYNLDDDDTGNSGHRLIVDN